MPHIDIIEGASDADIAGWIAGRLGAELAASDAPVAVCVPGGATPFPILELLANHTLEWPRVTIWPGDDRLVPEAHPASNVGRIRAALGPAGAEVVTLSQMEQVPHFALCWLGMGADGHVASLFASSDPQPDDSHQVRRLMPDPLPPEAPFERITLTIPALLDADELLFVARGRDKRDMFEAAAMGENDLPVARLLGAATQHVTCFT
jgi:6-phosphogluconolactonase